jgi:ParB family transcriptional regulator, chromosome partitioning protein
MTQKITLASSRDIPLNKLVLSQSNVRRIKSGISVDELAADIARRGLLQSLNVRPVLKDGEETGMFEVPAGGRRFQALQLLVKQKRLAKNAPVPCVVREASTDILAEDDSLAENVQRVPSTRSTSTAPSRPCATKACPTRTSRPRSLSA